MRTFVRTVSLFLLFLATVGAPVLWASWVEDGTPMCTALGHQTWPQIASDGAGGAIITWEDYRSGSDSDIYARRVDAAGVVQWTADGVGICTASGAQDSPQITSDGAGGVIITWCDQRSGYWDIYAQRVNASGVVQWTGDGVAMCTAAWDQYSPQVISDGAGGAIITWYDQRSGEFNNYDIYAQRVNASGAVQWTADGVGICTATGAQAGPQVISDGAGGAIVTWWDARSGNSDVYAQRVNASGVPLWTGSGVAVCTATGNQGRPQIVSDGAGGAIITWEDYRSGSNYDIYARRVDAAGVVRWTADGVGICTATGDQQKPQLASDGAGGACITWEDYRSGSNYDTYAQRITDPGYVLWNLNGTAICTASGDQMSPEITSDGASGAIITWYDQRSGIGNYDIYAQRIDAGGSLHYSWDGLTVCTAAGDQQGPQLISAAGGEAIITWYDLRGGNADIYALRVPQPACYISPSSIDFGSVAVGSTPFANFLITNTGGGTLTGNVSEICSEYSILSGGGSFSLGPSQTWLVTVQFAPTVPGTYNCTIQTGTELCSDVSCTGIGIPVPPEQLLPAVAFDGTNYLMVWHDRRSGNTFDIYGTRVSLLGVVLDPAGIAISAGGVVWERNPAIAFDGTNYLVVWQDDRNGVNNDIYGARVSKAGVVLDPSGILISAVPGQQWSPSVAFDGTNYLVVWEDSRHYGTSNLEIYGARVSVGGVVLDPGGVAISTNAVNDQKWSPAVAFDGTNYLVVWNDIRSGNYSGDIYGARVSKAGSVLDPSGIAISTATDLQDYPDVAFDGTNYLVVWEDYRSGSSYDIYGARVSVGGSVLDASGIAIATGAKREQYPAVAFDGANYRVVWDDYTATKIYGGRVSPGGTVLDPGGVAITTAAGTHYPDVSTGPVGQVLVVYQAHKGDPYNYYIIESTLWPTIVGVEKGEVPVASRVCQSYPNPFNPLCTIRYDISSACKASLKVFDVNGSVVHTLVDGWREPCEYSEVWDGRDDTGKQLPSGVYLLRLEAGDVVTMGKAVLLK